MIGLPQTVQRHVVRPDLGWPNRFVADEARLAALQDKGRSRTARTLSYIEHMLADGAKALAENIRRDPYLWFSTSGVAASVST